MLRGCTADSPGARGTVGQRRIRTSTIGEAVIGIVRATVLLLLDSSRSGTFANIIACARRRGGRSAGGRCDAEAHPIFDEEARPERTCSDGFGGCSWCCPQRGGAR